MPVAQAAEAGFIENDAPQQLWFDYSFAPPPGYAWNDAVDLLTRDVDNLFVPMWVCTVYRMPAGAEEKFWRQVIASGHPDWCEKPDFDFRTIGYSPKGIRPHRIIEILEKDPVPSWSRLPGDYIEISGMHLQKYKALGWLYTKLAESINAKDKQDIYDERAVQYRKGVLAEIKKTEDYWRAESNYRWDHDWNHMMRLAGQLNSEEQALIQKVEGRRRRGRVGNSLPPGVRL